MNKFIQECQSDTGLQKEDVRTLITADNTASFRVKSELTESETDLQCASGEVNPLEPGHVVTELTSDPKESQTNCAPLFMVTAATKESLTNTDLASEPLLVVMSGLTLDPTGLTKYHATSTPTRWSHLLNKPVPTSPEDTADSLSTPSINQPMFPGPEAKSQANPQPPLQTVAIDGNTPIDTHQSTNSITDRLDVTKGQSTDAHLNVADKNSTTHGNNQGTTHTSSSCMDGSDTSHGNNLITSVNYKTDTMKTTPHTEGIETTHGNKSAASTAMGPSMPSIITNIGHDQPLDDDSSKYYDILTPDKDDIMSISHEDIVSNKCEVSLEKLSNNDLEEIKSTLRNQSDDSSSSPSSSDVKPTKKVSLCPCKHTSMAKMRAQR